MTRKMTTRFIGTRELRQNLGRLLEEAWKKNIHFVVMRFGKVAGHITPPTERERELQELAEDIAEAREQVKRGEVYTEEEVATMLGIEL